MPQGSGLPRRAPAASPAPGAARRCGVSWACLWVTLAGTNWPCLSPLSLHEQHGHPISSGRTPLSWLPCSGAGLQPGQCGTGAAELGALVSQEENWRKLVADRVHHSLNSASSHGTPMPPPGSASCATLWAGARSTKHDFQLQGRLSPVRPKRY